MEVKPTVLWVEQLARSGEPQIPEALSRQFSVRCVASATDLELDLAKEEPACVVFDYDFPDRQRLSLFARTKLQHESVPMIVLTLQHSESLATWVYRNGALDFFVKPVDDDEIDACIRRLVEITTLRSMHSSKNANHYSTPIPDDIPRSPCGSRDRLAPAVFYVQQHYNEHIYADAMARLCNMSASHFSHAFRDVYDLTFQDFLLRYRVCRACKQLLGAEDVRIADVAYSVGFSDPSYFTRIFKRYIGVVPSDYAAAVASGRARACLRTNCDEALVSSSEIVRSLSGVLSGE